MKKEGLQGTFNIIERPIRTSTMDHWRLKFGKIEPSVWNHGNEFRKMIVEGVEMYVVNMGVEKFTPENLSEAFEQVYPAAKRLDERGVDCIIAGGSPIFALKGAKGEDELLDRINSEIRAPITTNLKSHVDAMKAVGAKSIIAVTPYPKERNEERVKYLNERGLEVVALSGINRSGPGDIDGVSSSTAYRAAVELAKENEGYDAIYISCPQWESASFIEVLEQDTGVPVIGDAQAQVWKAYQLGGISPKVEGYGQLFDTL